MSDLREGLAKALCEAWVRRSGIRIGGWSELGEIEANDFRGDADAALAYIRQHDGHAEFLRAVQSKALHGVEFMEHDGRKRNWSAYNRFGDILALCDAEMERAK